jgi:hypothetical protein
MNSRRLMCSPQAEDHTLAHREKPCCALQHFGPRDFRNGSFFTLNPRIARLAGVRCSFDSCHNRDETIPAVRCGLPCDPPTGVMPMR